METEMSSWCRHGAEQTEHVSRSRHRMAGLHHLITKGISKGGSSYDIH